MDNFTLPGTAFSMIGLVVCSISMEGWTDLYRLGNTTLTTIGCQDEILEPIVRHDAAAMDPRFRRSPSLPPPLLSILPPFYLVLFLLTSSLISSTEVRALKYRNLYKHDYIFPILSQILLTTCQQIRHAGLRSPDS